MVEHQIVDLAVAGSNPASHPFCPPKSYILNGWTIGRSSGTMPIVSTSAPILPHGAFRSQRLTRRFTTLGRVETELPDREANQVIGRTAAGRWLVVIWIDDSDG